MEAVFVWLGLDGNGPVVRVIESKLASWVIFQHFYGRILWSPRKGVLFDVKNVFVKNLKIFEKF